MRKSGPEPGQEADGVFRSRFRRQADHTGNPGEWRDQCNKQRCAVSGDSGNSICREFSIERGGSRFPRSRTRAGAQRTSARQPFPAAAAGGMDNPLHARVLRGRRTHAKDRFMSRRPARACRPSGAGAPRRMSWPVESAEFALRHSRKAISSDTFLSGPRQNEPIIWQRQKNLAMLARSHYIDCNRFT